MRLRFLRRSVVAGLLVLTCGSVLTPAHATTTFSLEFLLTVQVHDGIGYPLLTLGPFVPQNSCLPLQSTPTPNCHLEYDHERDVSGQDILCIDQLANVNKDEPLVHAPPAGCRLFVSGSVTGHCGLVGGFVEILYVNQLGNVYSLGVHFTGVGGALTLTGHWELLHDSTQHGLVKGDAGAIPVPTEDESCVTKTQEEFLVAGDLTGIPDPALAIG
ncbi:MAG: hypothetical protein M3394_07100 [Actinomycetota bacterium]|nr:hypothetical protein [Actinomycetota bacterium]